MNDASAMHRLNLANSERRPTVPAMIDATEPCCANSERRLVADLTTLANTSGTDKGTVVGNGHGYSLLYDQLFSHLRDVPIDLCEIGLAIAAPQDKGNLPGRSVAELPSVAMWRGYFPKARIVGVDISDCSGFAGEGFEFVRADCGDPAQLARVAELRRQFDIVVDDGSHASFHQQLTFRALFPLVKPGGTYLIEDLHWQPEGSGAAQPGVPRTDQLLGQFLRHGGFVETGALDLAGWNELAADIASIALYDMDWFNRHRRQYNARHGLTPDFPSYFDRMAEGSRSIRNLAGQALRLLRAELSDPGGVRRWPPVKLAVIRKRG